MFTTIVVIIGSALVATLALGLLDASFARLTDTKASTTVRLCVIVPPVTALTLLAMWNLPEAGAWRAERAAATSLATATDVIAEMEPHTTEVFVRPDGCAYAVSAYPRDIAALDAARDTWAIDDIAERRAVVREQYTALRESLTEVVQAYEQAGWSFGHPRETWLSSILHAEIEGHNGSVPVRLQVGRANGLDIDGYVLEVRTWTGLDCLPPYWSGP